MIAGSTLHTNTAIAPTASTIGSRFRIAHLHKGKNRQLAYNNTNREDKGHCAPEVVDPPATVEAQDGGDGGYDMASSP